MGGHELIAGNGVVEAGHSGWRFRSVAGEYACHTESQQVCIVLTDGS